MQQGISSLFKTTLRSLFTTLNSISAQLQQFIDEEPTFPTAMTTVQGTTVVGTVTAIATAVTNQLHVLSIPVSQVEMLSQPEPTLPVFHDVRTEGQTVIDRGVVDAPPEE